MLQHDAVLVGVPSIHRAGVEGVACRTRSVFAHPHVEVLVAWPLDELLHFRIPDVGQFTDDAVDSRVAVAVGIALGQTELDFNVRNEVFEFRNDFVDVGVQGAKVGVQHIHCVVNLGGGDVLGTVEVDHMEHNGDDQHILPLACRCALLRFQFQRTGRLHGGVARLRTTQEQHFFSVIQSTRRHAIVRVGLGCERRGQQAQQQREGPRAERNGHEFGESVVFCRDGKIRPTLQRPESLALGCLLKDAKRLGGPPVSGQRWPRRATDPGACRAAPRGRIGPSPGTEPLR